MSSSPTPSSLEPVNDNGSVWLTLPFPPSANNLFVNAGRRGRIKSSRYEMWLNEAGWELKSQRPSKMTGRVAVTIALCPVSKRRMDADNFNKPVLDLLVKHGVLEGDDSRFVREITVRWVDVGAHCSVFVERTA